MQAQIKMVKIQRQTGSTEKLIHLAIRFITILALEIQQVKSLSMKARKYKLARSLQGKKDPKITKSQTILPWEVPPSTT